MHSATRTGMVSPREVMMGKRKNKKKMAIMSLVLVKGFQSKQFYSYNEHENL
jgi:hypothetical protein